MVNRLPRSNKVVENLEKREKKDSDLRAAIARSKTRFDASRNAPGVIEPPVTGKVS
jgi:ribosomal protein RSM22 (predicted rRNA methylase)